MPTKEYYQSHKERYFQTHQEWRERNQERYIQYERQYYQDNRERILLKKKEYRIKHHDELSKKKRGWRKNNKHKTEAHNASKNIPLDKNCSFCGSTKYLEKHHPDYFKPLETVTLCHSCHKRLHAKEKRHSLQVNDP